MDAIGKYGHFSTAEALFYYTQSPQGGTTLHLSLEVWRLVTFQFLHANFTHVFFNMFGLFIFGGMVEQYLGKKKYLAFYLICGIFGGLAYLVLNAIGFLVDDLRTPLIGASAGVFGVIMACAFIAPNMMIQLLIPPIPLKMKWFAYGYVAIAAFGLLTMSDNAGGEAAHLGGAAAGYFFIRNSHYLRDFFDVFGNSNEPGGRGKRKKPRGRPGQARKPSEDEVDRVLQKVGEKGLHSLSSKEKKVLRKASEK